MIYLNQKENNIAGFVSKQPIDMVVDMYYSNNMKKEEFDKFLEEIGYSKGE